MDEPKLKLSNLMAIPAEKVPCFPPLCRSEVYDPKVSFPIRGLTLGLGPWEQSVVQMCISCSLLFTFYVCSLFVLYDQLLTCHLAGSHQPGVNQFASPSSGSRNWSNAYLIYYFKQASDQEAWEPQVAISTGGNKWTCGDNLFESTNNPVFICHLHLISWI